MDLNAGKRTDVGESLLHVPSFVLKLPLIGHVLPLASPANAEVRAGGLDAIRREDQELLNLCFGVGLFLSEDQGGHPVPGDSALHKDHQPVRPSDPLAAERDPVNVKLYNVSFVHN